jgi:hypothetical protein
MSISPRPVGSILPVLVAFLRTDNPTKPNGDPLDLTGLLANQFVMTIYNTNTKTDQIGAGTFIINNASQGIVIYAFNSADVATVGSYQLFISVPQLNGPRIMDGIPLIIVPK